MTWTAPDVDRTRPPVVAGERTALEGWLDFHRATLLGKCSGLTGDQLCARPVAPSGLSLLGLVRHMALVERWWFQVLAAGRDVDLPYTTDEHPDADFDDTDPARAAQDLDRFAEEVEQARGAVAELPLEHTFVNKRGREMDLRWVYLHMIEEYARHNGHADLLRECIDGTTGD